MAGPVAMARSCHLLTVKRRSRRSGMVRAGAGLRFLRGTIRGRWTSLARSGRGRLAGRPGSAWCGDLPRHPRARPLGGPARDAAIRCPRRAGRAVAAGAGVPTAGQLAAGTGTGTGTAGSPAASVGPGSTSPGGSGPGSTSPGGSGPGRSVPAGRVAAARTGTRPVATAVSGSRASAGTGRNPSVRPGGRLPDRWRFRCWRAGLRREPR
jgi:hypothetical protein